MPKRETKDGAHTVFTDHRIARFRATGSQESSPVTKLRAWREPRAPLALRNLGLANIEFGRRAQSPALMGVGANQVAQALKAFPDDPVMLNEMGLVLLASRQTVDAVKVLAYALKLAPNSAGAHVNLGNAYQQAGFFDKAITELNRAIELDPSFQDAYRSLETTYLRANNRQAARETLERYLKFMPQSITARSALAGPNSQ
jgi:tetratricopeptide (TPR) repeat protein